MDTCTIHTSLYEKGGDEPRQETHLFVQLAINQPAYTILQVYSKCNWCKHQPCASSTSRNTTNRSLSAFANIDKLSFRTSEHVCGVVEGKEPNTRRQERSVLGSFWKNCNNIQYFMFQVIQDSLEHLFSFQFLPALIQAASLFPRPCQQQSLPPRPCTREIQEGNEANRNPRQLPCLVIDVEGQPWWKAC